MATDFTNLEIWQQAIKIAEDVYDLTRKFPKEEKYSLSTQIRRASISISANIAEASGCFHYKDKINFLFNSRGSLEETRSHTIMAERLGYITSEDQISLDKQLIELRRRLNAFINTLSNKTS